jgi:HEAT repeat protein
VVAGRLRAPANRDKRAAPALLALARTDSSYARAFAIKGLGALKVPDIVPVLLPLIDPARATSGPTIQAIRDLARIGDARGEPVLTKLLYARGLNPMIRAETLLALGESAVVASTGSSTSWAIRRRRSPAVLQGLQAR